jgi:uncharacterized protein YuzE
VAEHVTIDYDEESKIAGIEMVYFVAKHKQDFYPVFEQIEQSL